MSVYVTEDPQTHQVCFEVDNAHNPLAPIMVDVAVRGGVNMSEPDRRY